MGILQKTASKATAVNALTLERDNFKAEGFTELVVTSVLVYFTERMFSTYFEKIAEAKIIELAPVVRVQDITSANVGLYCKIYGKTTGKSLLYSKFKGIESLYYLSQVIEKWDESKKVTAKQTNSENSNTVRQNSNHSKSSGSTQGNESSTEQVVWSEKTVVRESHEQESEIYLTDDNASVQILVLKPLDSKESFLTQVENRYVAESSTMTVNLTKKLLGVQYREQIVPVGDALNIYGEISVNENDGRLCIKKSRGKPWIVTKKLRDDLVDETIHGAQFHWKVGTVLGLLVAGLTTRAGYVLYQAYKK